MVCNFFHRYFQNWVMNCGPQSLWMTCDSSALGKKCLKYSWAVSLAVMVFKQGTKIASLVRLHMKFLVKSCPQAVRGKGPH